MEFFKGRPLLYPQYPSPACVCACELSRFTRVGLRDPMDCNPLGSSVHGILQARILEGVAVPFSRGFSQSRDQTQCPALQVILYSLSHQRSKYQERENIKKNQTNSGAEEYNN